MASRPARPIRLYWSQGKRVNFGDTLSPFLVSYLSGRPIQRASRYACDMVAIGSILHHVNFTWSKPSKKALRLLNGKIYPPMVWGTGAFSERQLPTCDKARLFAVRGKKSAAAIGAPEDITLGDPGLLIDRFDVTAQKSFRWGVIPHVDDQHMAAVKNILNATPGATMIDFTNPDLIDTIRQIKSCDFIASSSLHGLIAADALGIPNIWLRMGDNLVGGDWKFLDYFSSIDRPTGAGPVLFTPAAGASPDLRTYEETTAFTADTAVLRSRQAALETSFRAMGL